MNHRYTPWRALFISDVHLGTRACKADALLNLLSRSHYQKLYLVGDIIDFEQMRRRSHWPSAHNDIVTLIMARAKQGVEVIYVPGNHDALMRHYVGELFGHISVQYEAEYRSHDGKRLLVCHGDVFDAAVKYHRLWNFCGDQLNEFLLALNSLLNRVRVRYGLPYWSLSTYIKTHLKKANAYIARFQNAASNESQKRGYDGVICGHIHYGAIHQDGDFLYMNDGDWVESCSAIIETAQGEWQLLRHPPFAPQHNVVALHKANAA